VRSRLLLASLAISAFSAFSALPARAVLVVFGDGRFLHVKDFEVVEEKVTLRLEGGGSMTISLQRVDRIVDDEVDHTPPPPPVAASPALPSPPRSVRSFAAEAALPGSPYDPLIREAAREHRIDPALIAAVIRVESNFVARAVSRKGARGLMQLMPSTARRLGVRRAFDPRENIRGGAAYLAELAERFGERAADRILAAYNAGERAVESYGGIPPYRETRDYVRKVTAIWDAAHAVSGAATVTRS
jgi:hypothetical protein